VETREIVVRRTFADFDEYWATVNRAPSMTRQLAAMDAATATRLKNVMRDRLPAADGRVTISGTANAVKGRRA
jgi:hypothetical protein